jgi:hypothetical protein
MLLLSQRFGRRRDREAFTNVDASGAQLQQFAVFGILASAQ